MPINCTALTIITAILITIVTVYQSLYHSYFAVVNAESITHPYLIIKTENKLCQPQNRGKFAYDFTTLNCSKQDMNTLLTHSYTQIMPCACAMRTEYEIKIEISSLILSIVDTLKISFIAHMMDFFGGVISYVTKIIFKGNITDILFKSFVCYCSYISSMSDAIRPMENSSVTSWNASMFITVYCSDFILQIKDKHLSQKKSKTVVYDRGKEKEKKFVYFNNLIVCFSFLFRKYYIYVCCNLYSVNII